VSALPDFVAKNVERGKTWTEHAAELMNRAPSFDLMSDSSVIDRQKVTSSSRFRHLQISRVVV
jgi:hypothetical protein